MTKNNIGIVVANYYNEYTEKLLNGATSTLDGSFNYEVFSVPGAWDTVYKINSLVDSLKLILLLILLINLLL